MSADAVMDGLDRLYADLADRRRQLERQMEVLAQTRLNQQRSPGVGPAVLLAMYLDMSSAKAVADYCNRQGWRTEGAKGLRCFQPTDIYCAIREGAPGLDPTLQAMARQKLDGTPGPEGTTGKRWSRA
jgi:hypothetical protein